MIGAFAVFNRSFELYREFFPVQSFSLFECTCAVIIRLSYDFPDLATSVTNHEAKLSQIMHSPSHPFGRLMEKLYAMDTIEIRHYLRPLLGFYFDWVESCCTPTSSFLLDITVARCAAIERQAIEGLLEGSIAEDFLQRTLMSLESQGYGTYWRYFQVQLALGSVRGWNKKYCEVRLGIAECMELAKRLEEHSIVDNCYSLLSLISVEADNEEEILGSLNEWITFSQAHLGLGDFHRTIIALSQKECYLRRIGRDDVANEALHEMEDAIFESYSAVDEPWSAETQREQLAGDLPT